MKNDKKEVLVRVKDMHVTFGRGKKTFEAVRGVNFDIYKGETFGLVGESGSGKTTIGRAIIRLYPIQGEVIYQGERISGKISRELDKRVIQQIQMIFQDPMASLNERAKVSYIVSEGLLNIHKNLSRQEIKDRVDKVLLEVGLLPEFSSRFPHEFSGGQRQRIGIARALIMEPSFIIADEPISALDVSIRAQILNLMNKFKEERNTTCLFIAHDLSIVRYISDRIGVIYKGDIVEIATSEELFNYPLHPYTRSLISAIPLPDPKLEKHKVLYTYDPSIHSYAEGEKPELTLIGHDHYVAGSPKEIEEYRAIREKNEPLKTLFIVGINAEEPEEDKEKDAAVSNEVILERPIHDTGSGWYVFLSFLLPLLGLIAAYVFRRHNHIRNYKACRKGAIAFFALLGILLVIFLLLLVIAVV